jgi:hypothetical protein
MRKARNDLTIKGRSFGIFLLTIVQLINGLIHTYYGLAMVSGIYSVEAFSVLPMVYSIYTLAYGLLNLIFIYLFWVGKRSGWFGTMLVSLFVLIVDVFAILNLMNFLGITAFSMAVFGEILYSTLLVVYLLQAHVRSKYNL